MEEEKARDWSLLPSDLLVLIAEHLRLADIARLSAVCGGWAWDLACKKNGFPVPPPDFRAASSFLEKSSPWLLLPNEDGEEAGYCDFLHPCFEKESQSQSSVRISHLPEMSGRICVGGSPDGWMATVDMWLNLRILNPLTGEEYPLPPLSTLRPHDKMTPTYSREGDGSIYMIRFRYPANNKIFEKFKYKSVKKVIICSAPPHGIVFLLHGCRLAMAKIGDLSWSPALDLSKYGYDMIEDVVCNDRDCKFYIVTTVGKLIVLDLKNYNWGSSQPTETIVLGSMRGREFEQGRKYVVFSSTGDLLHVLRQYTTFSEVGGDEFLYDVREETSRIKVFRFGQEHYDGENPDSCWVQITDLGNEAMFIGFNYSTCISTINKPWLRENCVYFTEDTLHFQTIAQKRHVRDAGIFDLKNEKVERFFLSDSKFSWPPPAWFIPFHLQHI